MFSIYNTTYGKFLLNPADNISKWLIEGNFWEEELKEIFDTKLTKDDTIVEIGSYVGDHTVYLSKLCKKIYAYEAITQNFYQLCANLLLNNCTNVTAYNYIMGNGESVKPALEKYSDEFCLDLEENASGARFVPFEEADVSDLRVAVPLDSLISESISLLKVDAEGMDLSILKGSQRIIKEHSPIILCEHNSCICEDISEYAKFFDSINYSFKQVSFYNWLAERV